MSILHFLLLLLVAGICGSLGKVLGGKMHPAGTTFAGSPSELGR